MRAATKARPEVEACDVDDDPSFPLPQPHEVVDEYAIRLVRQRRRPWSILHPHEKVLLYQRLIADGWTDSTIRSRFRIGEWTVRKLRAESFPQHADSQ